VAKIKRDIGNFNLKALHHIKKPELRRHVMAIAADAKRREIEDATGIKISGAEYTEIKLHARFPEKSGGLTATVRKAFMPDRANRIWGKLRLSKESVLETRLNVQDMSLMAFKHSDFGKGFRISADDMILYDNKIDRKKAIPKTKRPSGAVDHTRNLGAYILDFVSPTSEPSRSQAKR
jgi:hypothetical protein